MPTSITVTITPLLGQQIYNPRYLSITAEHIIGCSNSRNLSFYLGYCSKEQYEERVIPIKEAMENYNSIVRVLWETPGFKEFFAEHNSVVSKEDVISQFGDEVASLAFSLRDPPYCYPDLCVLGNSFQLRNAGYQGRLEFNDKEYSFVLDGHAGRYPEMIDGKICFWNWARNNTDFALYFAKYVEERLPKGVSIFTDLFYDFDYYDQWRGSSSYSVDAINEVFAAMEQRNYLTRYELKADNYKSIWDYYTETDTGTVGLILCDPKAFRDKLLIARINALLTACAVRYDDDNNEVNGLLIDEDGAPDLNQKHYYLQDSNDNTYLSKQPGLFSGHYKLKIYGRLDCPSAARYIAKGQYVRHRVFFENEATAIAAGYRPCSICMPEAYKAWKMAKKIKP